MLTDSTQPQSHRRAATGLIAATLLAATLTTTAMRVVRAADTAADAVYICRPAVAGETFNARMTATTDTSLACRPVSAKLKMSNGSMRMIGSVTAESPNGPDLTNALSADQINDAWIKWLDGIFNVNHTS